VAPSLAVEPRDVLSMAGSIAVIIGVCVGVLQLRALRQQRQLEMVLRAYEPFLQEPLTRAYWRVHNWEYESFDEFLRKATLDDWTDLDQVTTFFEMMGVMAKRGVAKLDLLDDLFAGSLVMMWAKVAPFVRGYRETEGVRDYGINFEGLANTLEARIVANKAKAEAAART
jgi:hypothetical protein